jgi:hypothetical protein
MPAVSPQPEPSPEVAIMVVETPMAAAAAFGSPAKVVEFANPQPASVAAMSGPKADSGQTLFDWKRFLAIPLLIIGALAVLAIWGAKWIRAARSSGPSA